MEEARDAGKHGGRQMRGAREGEPAKGQQQPTDDARRKAEHQALGEEMPCLMAPIRAVEG